MEWKIKLKLKESVAKKCEELQSSILEKSSFKHLSTHEKSLCFDPILFPRFMKVLFPVLYLKLLVWRKNSFRENSSSFSRRRNYLNFAEINHFIFMMSSFLFRLWIFLFRNQEFKKFRKSRRERERESWQKLFKVTIRKEFLPSYKCPMIKNADRKNGRGN